MNVVRRSAISGGAGRVAVRNRRQAMLAEELPSHSTYSHDLPGHARGSRRQTYAYDAP